MVVQKLFYSVGIFVLFLNSYECIGFRKALYISKYGQVILEETAQCGVVHSIGPFDKRVFNSRIIFSPGQESYKREIHILGNSVQEIPKKEEKLDIQLLTLSPYEIYADSFPKDTENIDDTVDTINHSEKVENERDKSKSDDVTTSRTSHNVGSSSGNVPSLEQESASKILSFGGNRAGTLSSSDSMMASYNTSEQVTTSTAVTITKMKKILYTEKLKITTAKPKPVRYKQIRRNKEGSEITPSSRTHKVQRTNEQRDNEPPSYKNDVHEQSHLKATRINRSRFKQRLFEIREDKFNSLREPQSYRQPFHYRRRRRSLTSPRYNYRKYRRNTQRRPIHAKNKNEQICSWQFVGKPNCKNLIARLTRFKYDEMDCYNEYLLFKSSSDEYRFCGTSKFSGTFRAEGDTMTIEHHKRSQIISNFEGYVTCV